MFQIGDKIVYGASGVCTVTGFSEDDDGILFYQIQPTYAGYQVSVPVDSELIFMRRIMTAEEAKAHIASFATVDAPPFFCKVTRELNDHYNALLKSHSVDDLVKLIKSCYIKRNYLRAKRKTFGAVDARALKKAEDLLFGELAVCLGIDREEVPALIRVSPEKKTTETSEAAPVVPAENE